MYTTIGVPINASKSKFSSPKGHFLEFVSRNAWNGVDYSTLSAKLSAKTLKQPFMLATFVAHIQERFPPKSVPSLEEVYSPLMEKSSVKKSTANHFEKLKLLFKLYQDLSGTHLIKVDSEIVFNRYRQLVLSLILKAADDVVSAQFGQNSSQMEEATDLVSTFVNGEYECQWTYFKEYELSLGQVQFFTYATGLINRLESQHNAGAVSGHIHDITGSHPVHYVTLDGEFPINKHILSLIINVVMEAKCKREGIKILHQLHSLHPKNAKPMVELFKSLNICVNEAITREDWKLSMKETMVLRSIGLARVYKSIHGSLSASFS